MIWFFYILIIVLSGFIFPKYHLSQTFKSLSPEKIFDKNEEPLIYSHITDIHLKKVMPNRIKKIRQLFKKLKNYKIDFNRFTGDLVHNYQKLKFPKIDVQVLEDWMLFRQIINE